MLPDIFDRLGPRMDWSIRDDPYVKNVRARYCPQKRSSQNNRFLLNDGNTFFLFFWDDLVCAEVGVSMLSTSRNLCSQK